MPRTRIGIITTPERELFFRSAFEARNVLFNIEWLAESRDILFNTELSSDPSFDISSILQEWKDAEVTAAILDETVMALSPFSMDKVVQWHREPSSSSLPLIIIGMDHASVSDFARTVEGAAFGGIIYPSREPSLWRALGSRLDAITSMKAQTEPGFAQGVPSIDRHEESRTPRKYAGNMKKRGLFNRRKKAHAAEEELYRSLGGRSPLSEKGGVESFFPSMPTPSYPENNGIRTLPEINVETEEPKGSHAARTESKKIDSTPLVPTEVGKAPSNVSGASALADHPTAAPKPVAANVLSPAETVPIAYLNMPKERPAASAPAARSDVLKPQPAAASPAPSQRPTFVEPQPAAASPAFVVQPQPAAASPAPSQRPTFVEPQPAAASPAFVVEPQPAAASPAFVVQPQPAAASPAPSQRPTFVEPQPAPSPEVFRPAAKTKQAASSDSGPFTAARERPASPCKGVQPGEGAQTAPGEPGRGEQEQRSEASPAQGVPPAAEGRRPGRAQDLLPAFPAPQPAAATEAFAAFNGQSPANAQPPRPTADDQATSYARTPSPATTRQHEAPPTAEEALQRLDELLDRFKLLEILD